MSFLKAIRNNGSRDVLKGSSVILLLCLYTAGNTSFGIFHQLFHAQETSLTHSAEQEKDPCHRAIYHFEKDSICAHNSHLTVNEKCDQCHLLFHTDQITFRNSSVEPVKPHSIITESLIPVQLTDISIQLPSRAPPLI